MPSQFKQDQIILNILNKKTKGYFLDIGSSHPFDLSNTHILESQFKWSGLAVDPRKGLSELFATHRTCLFENSAIFTHTGTIKFSDTGVLAGVYDAEITDQLTSDKNKIYDVSCITFDKLFTKYQVPDLIDYISLDVEGAELLLLEIFPFDKKTVLTLSVEHNSHLGERQTTKAKQIVQLMDERGFVLDQTVKCDYIFVNKNLKEFLKNIA